MNPGVPVAHPVAPRTSDPEVDVEAGPVPGGGVSPSTSAAAQNMPPADPGRSYGDPPKEYVARCWGCGQDVSLPLYAAVFKCGYCGAVTYDYDSREAAIWIKPQKPKRKWVRFRDIVTVALVLTLISVIITGGGVWATFPLLFPTYSLSFFFHSFLVAFFFCNTVFNFLCASLLPAGPVEPLPFGSVELVRAGSLTDCSLCQQCTPPRPKPTRAHHCRQCGECVQDMDHHCPFIGNCVGQSNQRHFMVFLAFATLSCTYAATMATITVTKFFPTIDFSPVWQRFSDFAQGPSAQSFFYMLPHVFVEFIFCVGLRGGALLYIFGISVGTAICTSVLLFQQLKFIFEGVSYIDSLKKKKGNHCAFDSDATLEASSLLGHDKSNAGVWGQRLALLRGVFGTGSMWTWLLPRMSPPKGSRLDKKHHN